MRASVVKKRRRSGGDDGGGGGGGGGCDGGGGGDDDDDDDDDDEDYLPGLLSPLRSLSREKAKKLVPSRHPQRATRRNRTQGTAADLAMSCLGQSKWAGSR